MAKPATEVSRALAGRGRTITLHARRLDHAHQTGHLGAADLNLAYAGAFLAWCTSLETALETLFLGLLMKRYQISAAVRPLVEVRSDKVARAVVRGDRSYVDWLPFSLTTRRAKAFLASGLPFAALTQPHLGAFERTSKIRNAIAHDSTHAARVFRSEFVDGQNLPTWQHRPGGYLRGQHAGPQLRIHSLMSEGLAAITVLCS
jgi:hypothetical protein